MCRNIRVLYNFEPPTTEDEIRSAALQYVRKVSGLTKPAPADEEAFQGGVDAIASATALLLAALQARTKVRTREQEKEKRELLWKQRVLRSPTR